MTGIRIGSTTLHPLSDGFFGLDGGAMFGVVPRVIWQKTNPPDTSNRIRLALRPMLVLTPSERILVETGIGRKYGRKFDEMFNVDDSDDLERSLARHGLAPEEITIVVHTHLHFDHAGGATRLDENGKSVPRFPKARHVVQRQEWQDATHPNPCTRGSYRQDDLLPLEQAGLLELVDGDTELVSGVRLQVTGGHTKSHQIVLVSDGSRTAVYWGDLIPTCSHVRIPYIMGYDLFPLVTIEQKEKLVRQAIDGNWVCFFEHDPDVAVGTIADIQGRPTVKALVPEQQLWGSTGEANYQDSHRRSLPSIVAPRGTPSAAKIVGARSNRLAPSWSNGWFTKSTPGATAGSTVWSPLHFFTLSSKRPAGTPPRGVPHETR